MPSNLKLLQTNTFTGCMNSDMAEEILPQDSYRNALNVHVLSTTGGQKGIITNCKGTTEIEFTLPAGNNVCIGAKDDTEKDRFYFLNWNSNGFSGIYMYNSLLNQVIPIILNLTDTNNVDIFEFTERGLVLHIDVVRSPTGDDLFYFAQGDFKAKKFNIQKALDKSPTGYGAIILPEYINAYKLASIFPPSLSYFTDTTRESNYLFTYLFKASVRHLYDDGEKNNWSEFSTVPLPLNEGFSGSTSVSNVNNGLKITVETGSSIVTQIEIAIQISGEPFVSIIVLDKDRLGIPDDSTYDYLWYNDNASYSGLDQLNVYRAYSYLPLKPALQAFTKNSMVYGKGLEGFPIVDVDVDAEVIYSDLFIPDATVNELNDPSFEQTAYASKFTRVGDGRRTNSRITLTIGFDVKAGNKFDLFGRNGDTDNPFFTYTATNADSAITVAANFKQQLEATGRILDTAPGLSPADIWVNTIDGGGNVSFSFIWEGEFGKNGKVGTSFTGQVNPVSVATLKNTGQSLSTHKSGGTIKYGIIYWDEDTRRSNTYTEDDAVVRTDFVTQTDGFKKVVHKLSIKNIPPVWAKYWELVRTQDLTYGNDFVQLLIQKAIESQSAVNTDYVDLIIGSLYTYQEMYPNTVVTYEFEKNDRVRLIKKEDDDTYYPFIETIVIDFKPVGTTETINEDVTTNDTSTVTIGGTTTTDNIGRYIVINGIEREIIAVPNGTTYTLDRAFGTSEKYPSFQIVDKRGILRVRKPLNVTIEDNSLVEVYKPTQNVESAQKNFYLFGQKYAITDWGTDLRAHTGNVQNQSPSDPVGTPAIVDIVKGTTYVRNRQLPTNNQIPGTQVVIDLVEDKGYSDFYASELNDNGKIAPEDDGSGQIRFGSRLRFSSNYIEGTRINGLNDFDNGNREDYNDPNGDIMLIKYREGLLYTFKQLRTLYIPILANIIVDEAGQEVLGTSDKLLNKAQYFVWEGGIGNMPESYASNQTWQYFLSPNSGVDCRIGGNGVLPISEEFNLDTRIQGYIKNAVTYSAFVFGGFDRENGERILTFESFNEYLYNSGFDVANWELFSPDLPDGTEFEITTQPVNGNVVIDGDGDFVYTPDTDFVGSDPFFYRWRVPAGDWTAPKKACLTVTPLVIPPPTVIYYNAELVVPFVKEGCPTAYHGSTVNYTVTEFTYSSPFSQEDADQQAIDEANVYGQENANEIGTCLPNDPDTFLFTDLINQPLSTLTESNAIVVSNDYPTYLISIVSGEYQINGGAWVTASGLVNAGDSVKLRKTTSASYNTAVTTTLTIGTISDTWSLTTEEDVDPDPFIFTDITNANISTVYTSNTITISGLSTGTSIAITVSGGEYSKNGSAYTSSVGSAQNGDTFSVRQTSSGAYSTASNCTLTAGAYSDTYTVTTKVAPSVDIDFIINQRLSSPYVNGGLEYVRNGVQQWVKFTNESSSVTATAGDVVVFTQISFLTLPWADNGTGVNSARLLVTDGGTLYDNTVTTQVAVLNTYSFTVLEGGNYVVDASTDSTMTGYDTYTFELTTYTTDVDLELQDSTDSAVLLIISNPQIGVSAYLFNVLSDGNPVIVPIDNTSATDGINVTLNGVGYTNTIPNIPASSSDSFTDAPKGNLQLGVTPNSGTSCGIPDSYTGGETFPTVREIVLGSGLGTVTLNFDAQTVPDKFIVVFDGVEVINTGYRGSTSQQSALDAALASRGLPPELITSPGNGSANFVKSTATTIAYVYVYAPIGGTVWNFTMLCPV